MRCEFEPRRFQARPAWLVFAVIFPVKQAICKRSPTAEAMDLKSIKCEFESRCLHRKKNNREDLTMMRKKKCTVCGFRFRPISTKRYEVKEPNGFMAVLTTGTKRFDAIDCYCCGCQHILKERIPKASKNEEAEPEENEPDEETTPSEQAVCEQEVHDESGT